MIIRFLGFWDPKGLWNPSAPMTKVKQHLLVQQKKMWEKYLRQRGHGTI